MSLIDVDAQMRYDQAIMKFMVNVMIIADQRRHFGDDEYLPPLPIHGSARMYDRRTTAEIRNRSINLQESREVYNVPNSISINPEEGA